MNAVDLPLIRRVDSGWLVFGLEWFPLLGSQPRRQSLRLARKQGASHFVLGGDHAGSVGLAGMRLAREHRKTSLYSAAQSLAGRFPQGTVAVLIEVPDYGWWLSVVHQGAVVARTDRLYPSAQLAYAAADELRPAYPQLRLLDADTDPPAPALAQLLEHGSGSTLQPAGRWYHRLPWPVRLFTVALLLVAALSGVWRGPAHNLSPDSQPVEPDPEVVWREAIQHAVAGRSLHGTKVSAALLASLYGLPVSIAGWQLLQAECLPASASTWNCSGDYQRRGHQASNVGFLKRLPDGWSIRFPTMDTARAGWTLPVSGYPLAWQSLRAAADTDRYLVSSWQAIRTAFTQMELGSPVALPVVVPRGQDGQAIPRPAGLPLYLSRPTHIGGPLRSFALLVPHTAPIEWSRVVLRRNDVAQATLQSSQLSVSFQGVLHEIQTIPN